jgi:hypothetical protein
VKETIMGCMLLVLGFVCLITGFHGPAILFLVIGGVMLWGSWVWAKFWSGGSGGG